MSDVAESNRTRKIRALNNHCRCTFTGCSIMLTSAVAELDPELKAKVLEAVRTFDNFDKWNDPHHEADMALFDIGEDKFFWKFDYYEPSMKYGSDDPSDVTKTRRVLTIGFASDY